MEPKSELDQIQNESMVDEEYNLGHLVVLHLQVGKEKEKVLLLIKVKYL